MRIIYTEQSPIYSSYTFPYGIYAELEKGEPATRVYDEGFLPYSADVHDARILFYKCRSLRVDLERYAPTSENKRVEKKLSDVNVTCQIQKKEDFTTHNSFYDFCSRYIAERFAPGAMDLDRLKYIIDHPCFTHVWVFKNSENILGYVLSNMYSGMMHYWFAFLNTEYISEYPLGKYIMWKTIDTCKEMGLQKVYLGTSYGPKSLYKIRDHKGLAWHDGNGWSQDVKSLKEKCKQDKVQ